MKWKKKIYMLVTEDEYELPLAIGDTPRELANIIGVKEETVKCGLSRKEKKYRKVDLSNEKDCDF